MSTHPTTRRIATFAAVIGFLITLAASPVLAQTTLTGENLIAEGVWGASPHSCGRSPAQTFTFEAEGVAVGPYPGTFTETGSFMLVPEASIPSQRSVLKFHADFTITVVDPTTGDPTGEVVTGTKELTRFEPRNQSGACVDGPDGEARGAVAGIPVCYRAILPDGSVDTGVLTGMTLGFDETGSFQESFISIEDVGGDTHRKCATQSD